eukprot:3598889-Pleurochrysis_carterae.AAC.1
MARARRGARKQAVRVSCCARGARTCRTPALRRGALGSQSPVVAPADVAQRRDWLDACERVQVLADA